MNGEVRPERTYWRDAALSERHRKWGWDCPAIDIDFLLNEYDCAQTRAIIEYKNELAPTQWSSHPSYRAVAGLGSQAGVPVFAVRYASDFSWWRVTPLNQKAKNLLAGPVTYTEYEYVSFLYRLRDREMPPDLLEAMEL